jgi:parallel beta-helix repeat protein
MIRLIRTLVLLALALMLVKWTAHAAVGRGGGGAPNVKVLSPGSGLTATLANVANGTTLQLGDGTYTVTPSILNSNLQNGNQFTGAMLANKTNITFIGVPGQTIIDGSSSPGEVLWMTNCQNVFFYGVTFVGWTNHNIMEWPLNSQFLWAGVNFLKCERLTFDTCAIIRHADHGLQDKGAETPASIAAGPPSTNQIIVRNTYFHDIGSFRTNTSLGTIFVDGTSIVPTAMTIDNCVFDNVFRGVEPYDENAAPPNSQRFFNGIVRNSTFRNVCDFGISTASSTNGHYQIIENNLFDNDQAWSLHGTNFGVSAQPPLSSAIYNNAGRGWSVRNNEFRGTQTRAVYFYGVTDGVIDGNVFYNITNRTGISGAGIQLEGTTNIIVRNNFMRGTKDAGIYLFGAKDTTVEGNHIHDAFSGYGIQLASFGSFTASNNVIRNNRIIVSNTGVWDQNAGLLLQTYVFNNEIVAPTKIFNAAGDYMQIEGPPRVFNYTNDFPSIAAGGSFRTNFPAIGAKTNDFAYLMTPDQFYRIGTNISVNTWASNDVVWVWIHNNGPSAADPGNVRFKAVVKQVEAY